MKKRLAKKRYKQALTRIAVKIQAAFADKNDRKRWISHITALWMQDHKEDGI